MSAPIFTSPDSVEGLQQAMRKVDEIIDGTEEDAKEQANVATIVLRGLDDTRFAMRKRLLLKGDQQCREATRELPNAVLERLPRELRDMVYLALHRGSQDEPYEVVDNNSRHPYDAAYGFAPMVKAYDAPYWMLERDVGHEFAQEAVEA